MDRCPVWQNIIKKLREGGLGNSIALLLQVRTVEWFLPHQAQKEHLWHVKETNLRITSLRHFCLVKDRCDTSNGLFREIDFIVFQQQGLKVLHVFELYVLFFFFCLFHLVLVCCVGVLFMFFVVLCVGLFGGLGFFWCWVSFSQ